MPAGRPSQYKPEYCEKAKKLCLLGAIDREIADFFGVSEVTLNSWKAKYPKFLKSLVVGKEELDKRVERKLYEKAIGYSTTEKGLDKNGEEVETTKHYPADTKAITYWLNNRKPKTWKNRHEVKADVNVNDSLDAQLIEGRQNLRKKMAEAAKDTDKQ